MTFNPDAIAALSRLRQRAETLGSAEPDHFVFPGCQRLKDRSNQASKGMADGMTFSGGGNGDADR